MFDLFEQKERFVKTLMRTPKLRMTKLLINKYENVLEANESSQI